MPRYFFHYRTDDGIVRDTDGSDHPDLDAAERKAAELGRAILDRALSDGDDAQEPRSIEITDAAGEELLYVVFWAGPPPRNRSGPLTTLEPATLH